MPGGQLGKLSKRFQYKYPKESQGTDTGRLSGQLYHRRESLTNFKFSAIQTCLPNRTVLYTCPSRISSQVPYSQKSPLSVLQAIGRSSSLEELLEEFPLSLDVALDFVLSGPLLESESFPLRSEDDSMADEEDDSIVELSSGRETKLLSSSPQPIIATPSAPTRAQIVNLLTNIFFIVFIRGLEKII